MPQIRFSIQVDTEDEEPSRVSIPATLISPSLRIFSKHMQTAQGKMLILKSTGVQRNGELRGDPKNHDLNTKSAMLVL
jgi:hypothetical protein